jgi:UDP-3-O-[3-hydroxymyristoyl] glucosamine N-acyltransferase
LNPVSIGNRVFSSMPGFELNLDLVRKLTSPTRVAGDWNGTITRIASLANAQPGDLSFLSSAKHRKIAATSKASAILLPEDFTGEPALEQTYLYHGNPSRALDLVCEHIQRRLIPKPVAGIHSTAIIHPSAVVPDSVSVGPFVVIEEGVVVGEDCVLEAHVFIGRSAIIGACSMLKARASVLQYCQVGSDCVIHSGAVIGSDGFGYETVGGQHLRSPQIGIVVLEDHVDVGSNSTIDRARFNETRIGQGTKIDNLVQIAHNVIIGKGCFLASQVGIAGSAIIGDFVLMGGKSGVSGHISVGDFCQIGGSTAVYQNLPAKSFVSGDPAMAYYQAQKFNVLRKRLPDLFRRVDQLENHPPSDP